MRLRIPGELKRQMNQENVFTPRRTMRSKWRNLLLRGGILAEPSSHRLGAEHAAVHAEQYAAGEDRIDERVGVSHHDVAIAAHPRGLVRVVAGGAGFVVDQDGVAHAVTHLRMPRGDRLEQVLGDAALALLEVGRPADRADAHGAVLERDHPEPAVLEPVHADVAFVLALSAVHVAEVAEDRGAGVVRVLALELELPGEESVSRPEASTKKRQVMLRLSPCSSTV